MAKKGLLAWVKENWVDIANKRSDGSYPKCGRSGGEKRKKYPKCVPRAKAKSMTAAQRKSAVERKRAKPQGVGGKPTMVRTIERKKKTVRKRRTKK